MKEEKHPCFYNSHSFSEDLLILRITELLFRLKKTLKIIEPNCLHSTASAD